MATWTRRTGLLCCGGPTATKSSTSRSPERGARSLDSLNEAQGLLDQDVESPLLGSSPALSPMQVAGGSPTHSPMQQTATQLEPRTAALTSPTHSPMQQTATQMELRTAALTSPTPPSLRVSIAQSQKIMYYYNHTHDNKYNYNNLAAANIQWHSRSPPRYGWEITDRLLSSDVRRPGAGFASDRDHSVC